MIGTVTATAPSAADAPDPDPSDPTAPIDASGSAPADVPDPALADAIRSALADAGPGTAQYLAIGARLDRVSAVEVGRAAVAWRSLHATWDRPWIIAMGADGREVARCVTTLVARSGVPEGLTVAREAFPRLPESLRPVEHWEWDWWFTTQDPAPRPGEDRVIDLDLADPRIPALLAVASPDAMVRPGDRRILRWAGITAAAVPRTLAGPEPGLRDDALVAVAAVTAMRPGIPHLGSVATRAGWRGHGLARDLCARLTRESLAEGAPAVTLGMHAANRSARSVYDTLGYRVGYRWASGPL
jgi:GNAT superfamily N-acetyltransferase